ncbi:hypothetical protein [Rhodopila globiformis]
MQALLKADILETDDAGRIVFSYDAVHVDFVVGKVAQGSARGARQLFERSGTPIRTAALNYPTVNVARAGGRSCR